MRTFITFIGKGQPDKTGRFHYAQVKYRFAAGEADASCFANAVLSSGGYHFDRVCVIGTPGSTWEQLLEPDRGNLTDSELNLAAELCGAPPEKLASLREELTQTLQRRWQVPEVELLMHPAELTGNEEAVLDAYLQLLVKSAGEVVLDVTHSYRWMPLFLTSALRLRDALGNSGDLKILYGEFSGDKTCPVRELDALWDAGQCAADISLFFDKWEAGPLAVRLEPRWPSGAKALQNLGNYLQGNYLVPLVWDPDGGRTGKPLLAMRNALDDFAAVDRPPCWLVQTKKRLQQLVEQLTKPDTHSGQLLVLAQLYADRQMYGQALLCQEIAFRLYCLEQQNRRENEFKGIGTPQPPAYPTWEDVKDLPRKSDVAKEEGKKVGNILHNRNNVAHGALQSAAGKSGGIPQAVNLKTQFESQQNFLLRTFSGDK